nr:MAG TPA: hypothetical protein [Caudoviricetes sp.]
MVTSVTTILSQGFRPHRFGNRRYRTSVTAAQPIRAQRIQKINFGNSCL